MDFYFGIDLLQQLRQYYEGRLSLALAKGFDQQDAKYHWLFKELECRVSTLRKLMSMISVLPEFMCRQTEEQVFAMVVSSTSSWFSDDVLGEQPRTLRETAPITRRVIPTGSIISLLWIALLRIMTTRIWRHSTSISWSIS